MIFLYASNAANVVTPKHAQIDLVERETFRNSRHNVSGFGAESFTSVHDIDYISRDRRQSSPRAAIASETSFRAYNGIATIK